ncbi:cysteine methyltransferase, partial [Streptomyces albidoflavus]
AGPRPAPGGAGGPAGRGGGPAPRATRRRSPPPRPGGAPPHGSLTGYAGGLERKTWLLGLERTRTAVPAG